MVGLGLRRHLCEVVVAQRVLLRVGKVGRNVRFSILLFHRLFGSIQPCRMIMGRIAARWRILGARQYHAIRSREGSKIIIERMVLFHDDHHVFDRIPRCTPVSRLRLPVRPSPWPFAHVSPELHHFSNAGSWALGYGSFTRLVSSVSGTALITNRCGDVAPYPN